MRQNRFKADWVARRDFLRGSALILTGALLGRTLPLMAQQPPDSAGRADPNLIEDLIADGDEGALEAASRLECQKLSLRQR